MEDNRVFYTSARLVAGKTLWPHGRQKQLDEQDIVNYLVVHVVQCRAVAFAHDVLYLGVSRCMFDLLRRLLFVWPEAA